MRLKNIIFAAALASTATAPALAAETETFKGDYTVSFLGVTVARSVFVSTITGDNVSVTGDLHSAGIAAFFDSTTATSSFEGSIGANNVVPHSFQTNYTTGKKKKSIAISFAGGNVTKTVAVPPPKKHPKWAPLRAGDLVGVLDPISATMVRAKGPADVCRRTIKVYDGEMRANLVLSPASIGKVPGYGPEAVTCSAKFVPISGYRTDSSGVKYLRDRSKITISFAPLGSTGLYAPARASIGTKVGAVSIVARLPKR